MNPTRTALQRRGPTLSPSSGTDNAVTMIGDENPIAEAVASGTNPIPLTDNAVEASSKNERVIWIAGRCARKIGQPRVGRNTATIVRKCPAKRAHTISIRE
jgi:hypothetical protein